MISNIKSLELSNDLHLPYFELGDTAGYPVIFLHGFTGSLHEFEPIFKYLPQDHHAIALTLRGHGDATHPESGYPLSDFSTDVENFLQAMDATDVILVGHSMGSAVAQRFAIDNPENTLGLVLVSAVYTLPGDLKLQEYFDSTISKLEDPIDPEFVRIFLDSIRVKPISDELFEVLYHEALKVPARVWIQAFEGRLIDNISEELGRIQSPTLLIWGDQDHRSLRKDQDAILAAIPDSRLKLYKGSGHLVHLEESEDFASDIANFLEEVTIAGAS